LSLYLDTSVLVAMFVEEAGTARAQTTIAGQALLVSDFAAAEFSSAISRRVRTGDVPVVDGPAILAAFDAWTAQASTRVVLDPSDGAASVAFVRRFELGLRAPDALHLAAALRLGAKLFTFDERMAVAAAALGLESAA
jgi:uncharacterized protein